MVMAAVIISDDMHCEIPKAANNTECEKKPNKRSRKVLSRQINSGLCRLFLKICSHVEFRV